MGDQDGGAQDCHSLEKRASVFWGWAVGGGGWDGCRTGEGVQQKTFQETQRDNLLIHGRLLQCVMCSYVHTCARVWVAPCLFVLLCFTSVPLPHRPSPAVPSAACLTPTRSALPLPLSPFHPTRRGSRSAFSPSLVAPLLGVDLFFPLDQMKDESDPTGAEGRTEGGFSLRLLVFLCPWPWWG